MIKATINFKTIQGNIKKLRKTLSPGVKVCAVVKANAYSLGDVAVAGEIQGQVDCFAVATVTEAVRLRAGNIVKPILLFGVCDDIKTAISNNIIISINSVAEMKTLAKYLENSHKKCKVHIKVNTGMNRYGITSIWQLRSIIAVARTNLNIKIDGLYTQFAFAIDDITGMEKQLNKFLPFRSIVRAYSSKAIIHAACSNNTGYVPAQFDMVRIGKLIYGGYDGYRTAIKITSKITAVQHLKSGAKVGYNATEGVTAPTTVAVVPCGYADLIHYRYSNTHKVLVGPHYCKILGRVCMDTIMVDVTGVKNPIGKTVTIIADKKGLALMDIAKSTHTIVCNILCSFNFERCEVVYKK